MLPPAWISFAVEQARHGQSPRPPSVPPLQADGEWRRLGAASAFGDFPPSWSLFRHATTSVCEADPATVSWVWNARRTLQSLASSARALVAEVPSGPRRVAARGAEIVAQSDRRYFGEDLRRTTVVPILVENPNDEEIREGKGLRPASLPALSDEAIRTTLRALLRRRLQDGEVAVERYDIADREARARAFGVIQDVVGDADKTGHRLWVWLSGPTDTDNRAPADAPEALTAFRQALEDAGIPLARLGLLYMPATRTSKDPPRPDREQLRRAVAPIEILFRGAATSATTSVHRATRTSTTVTPTAKLFSDVAPAPIVGG